MTTQHAYAAIAATLREEIHNGTWPAGTALPTIPDLMERFGVSRITVRGALDQLATEGLVYTGYLRGKRGTIVRSRGRIDHYPTDALRNDRPKKGHDAFNESVRKSGRTPSTRFVMRIEVPPKEIARRLGVSPNELVVQRTSYQYIDGEPWSRERSYFALDLAKAAGVDTPNDIPEGFLRRLRDRGYGEIAHVDEIIDTHADAEEAADLSIPIGSPILVQTRTGATADRVTRVTRTIRIGRRSRLIWELGEARGIDVIRRTFEQTNGGAA